VRRREFVRAALAAVPVAGWRPARLAPEPRLLERWSWAMGQPVRLRLFHESESHGLEAAQAALAELRRVEASLSRFDPASDLSELNRRAGRGPMRAGDDLLAVLRAATRFRAETGGAFDVAVEPLMRAWGFRDPRRTVPGPAELEEARQAVRVAQIRIEGDRVSLAAAHTRLDLGGIGVGYALDRAGEVLRRYGVGRALLDVSGDILALGSPPGSAGWPVDVADPDRPGRRLGSVLLRDQALATSANTVSVVRLGGVLRGHVMDPERGVPADRLLQATVVTRTGMLADALSTAMLVGGRAWPDVDRYWIRKRGER
jgi:FAD:protein FMN transferase